MKNQTYSENLTFENYLQVLVLSILILLIMGSFLSDFLISLLFFYPLGFMFKKK